MVGLGIGGTLVIVRDDGDAFFDVVLIVSVTV
jgi:hypothetical protein